jgi:2'-5' RNA ligase
MESVRTFIAIELDPDVRTQVSKLQSRLKDDVPPGFVRWVRPEGIHLTLKFLGDTPADKLDEIARALQTASASHAPFSLHIAGIGCFPNPRRPRVIWLGVDEPGGTLERLYKAVERALTPLGHPPERRPFSPHLTLGRVKRGHSATDLEALGEYVTRAKVSIGQMEVTFVHLIRSDLRPTGAIYTSLAKAPLQSHTPDSPSIGEADPD